MTSSLGCQEGLRWVREALGVSVRDVADRLRLTYTTVNRFERGERRMYLNQAVTVAGMFGVPVDMLTRRPTTDELLELNKRRFKASEPAPAAPLLKRMIYSTGHGVGKTSRPESDVELRARGEDPALYEPGPAGETPAPEPEPTYTTDPSTGISDRPLDELLAGWDHGDDDEG